MEQIRGHEMCTIIGYNADNQKCMKKGVTQSNRRCCYCQNEKVKNNGKKTHTKTRGEHRIYAILTFFIYVCIHPLGSVSLCVSI